MHSLPHRVMAFSADQPCLRVAVEADSEARGPLDAFIIGELLPSSDPPSLQASTQPCLRILRSNIVALLYFE